MAGYVVSSKPAHIALRTAPLSNLPENNNKYRLEMIIKQLES
jgi:hypothetical protein